MTRVERSAAEPARASARPKAGAGGARRRPAAAHVSQRVLGNRAVMRAAAERERSLDELPEAARAYLDFITEFVGVPITIIGVGPGRDQVIWVGEGEEAALAAANTTEDR